MNIEKLVVGAIETNCYIVPLEKGGAIVIDPGDDSNEIIEKLRTLNAVPRYILLTHGHLDHIAALPKLIAHYAAKNIHCEIMIHKEDAGFLGEGAYQKHCASFRPIIGGDTSFINGLWEESPEPTKTLEDGDIIEQFKVIHLPGHSSGSVGFYDVANGILISGDTLFNCGVGRTDLPESDYDKLEESLRRLFTLPPETKVYPGHGASTTIGREAAYYS
jgi:glyoxylase-like metal-dependent hydrolase (beta-lactamase superfamily II)